MLKNTSALDMIELAQAFRRLFKIQNQIDAVAVGRGKHAIGEIQRAGIEDVLDAELAQIGALLVAAGGRIDLRAVALGDRDRGKTAATNLAELAKEETDAITADAERRELTELQAIFGSERKDTTSRSYRTCPVRTASSIRAHTRIRRNR